MPKLLCGLEQVPIYLLRNDAKIRIAPSHQENKSSCTDRA
jgi:hypothetical protein